MPKMKSLLAMAMVSAMAAQSTFSEGRANFSKQRVNDPDWKRKKCKSCKKCGNDCSPYNHRGHTLFRTSKPTFNACEKYSMRKK